RLPCPRYGSRRSRRPLRGTRRALRRPARARFRRGRKGERCRGASWCADYASSKKKAPLERGFLPERVRLLLLFAEVLGEAAAGLADAADRGLLGGFVAAAGHRD